jgi:hypothetical protein
VGPQLSGTFRKTEKSLPFPGSELLIDQPVTHVIIQTMQQQQQQQEQQ